MAKIIAIANQKGGVAKTTTTMNLADALTHLGKRVLMIDADPQGSLSKNLGFDLEKFAAEKKTLAHCFSGDTLISDVITNSSPSIITSSYLLDVVEDNLENDFTVLREMIKSIEHDYDFILFDTGPGLTKIMRNALGSAHYVLIPVKADKSSADGIDRLLNTIQKLYQSVNPRLRVCGVLPTMYKKDRKHDNDTLSRLKSDYGSFFPVFDPIPVSTWYDRAAESLRSVFTLRKKAPGRDEYKKLANHLIQLQ